MGNLPLRRSHHEHDVVENRVQAGERLYATGTVAPGECQASGDA